MTTTTKKEIAPKKKMGRPKVKDSRAKVIGFNCSEKEFTFFKKGAEKTNALPSALIRELVFVALLQVRETLKKQHSGSLQSAVTVMELTDLLKEWVRDPTIEGALPIYLELLGSRQLSSEEKKMLIDIYN